MNVEAHLESLRVSLDAIERHLQDTRVQNASHWTSQDWWAAGQLEATLSITQSLSVKLSFWARKVAEASQEKDGGQRMSEFMFLHTRTLLTAGEIEKLDAVAKPYGAQFNYVGRTPGQLLTGWFSSRAFGYPFDKMLFQEVESDLKKHKLIELL